MVRRVRVGGPGGSGVVAVMTISRLSAGSGYRYLLKSTATGDVSRAPGTALVDYYAASGNPPGRWLGAGLLGLAYPVFKTANSGASSIMTTGPAIAEPGPAGSDTLVSRFAEATVAAVSTRRAVSLSSSSRGRTTYDPDEIDFFFVIDGDFECHLIPVGKVGGLHAIHLSAYAGYRLDRLEFVSQR